MLTLNLCKKITLLILITATAILCGPILSAADALAGLKSGALKDVDASADSYEYVGSSIIARGHVAIRYQNMQITCDKAIIDIASQDIEASGNVVFASRETKLIEVDQEEYEKLLADPEALVQLERYKTTATGRQKVEIKLTKNTTFLRADRAAGNLITGTIQFKDFTLKTNEVYCSGKMAERTGNGTIVVTDAKLTTCNYITDDHAHYAIGAGKAVISPRSYDRGLFNYNPDYGEHSIWVYNSTLRLWDFPVFWFPALYKPAYTSSFGGKVEFGNKTSWGYYVRGSKDFQLLDEPYLNGNVMLDFYSKRGLGYGVNGDLITPESSTEFFFYGISDRSPYAYWNNSDNNDTADWQKNNSRLKIPTYRYELKLSNVTHITPRLDFRGQLDLLSDYNFLNDFFESRYDNDIQPPTYVGLEYQFDRFTASVYATPRVNSFYSQVERLPEMRLDFPRQELFSNIYYQGETSMDWLNMRWRQYDRPRIYGEGTANDYNTARFDTLHMFYYPFQLFSSLNIIPRAGVRMTAYSRSSNTKMDNDDLNMLFATDTIDGQPFGDVKNYDGKGGAQFRITGEIGAQMNTKIYRSWQNVKNAYWELDGLRHVLVPYVNYTYIPAPNVSRDYLFYFDDIDRITEQNFIRFGAVNRLQTRRNDQIYEWMSLENYWDFHFHRESSFSHVGDLGTLFTFNPFPGLTFTSDLLLDLAQTDGSHNVEAYRNGRPAGRPGISAKFIDRWYNTLSYSFTKNWRIYGSYNYSDAYNQRSTYSMGSMLTAVNSTSLFETMFDRHQTIVGGLEFPLFYEYTKLKGRFQVDYDFEAALMRNTSIGVSRNFHCWDLFVELGRKGRYGSSDGKVYSNYISFYVSLTAMPGARLGAKASP